MPAQTIGENLAFINWTVLTGLALGSFAVVVLGRLVLGATRGFLAFTAFCAAGFGLLAWLSDGSLPASLAGSPVMPDPAWDVPRRAALLAFALLAAAYLVVVARRRRGVPVAIAGLAAGLAVLVLGALTWGGPFPGPLAFVLQQALLAAATGGVFAAMILGHWYLVTPKLPEAPLVTLSRILLGVMAALLVGFLLAAGLGAGVPASSAGGSGPFAIMFGPWALFAWLRLIVGLVFPLVVSWMAVQTAKTRSMESATGLLYIDVGSIAAGTILAAGVFFGAGLYI
ncbi:MAG TPA: hypothetical protein VEY67_10880 [Candidatus Dormibacteraeota bacterium]|nr:hypothetical protein [Candidatus Dormibacteraeota bacterium]